MHQLLSLRPYWSEKKQKFEKTDATHFKAGWKFSSIRDIFDANNLKDIIAQIPETERYNIYFTVANCTDKKREFQTQEVICFDLDGIEIDRANEYIPIVLSNLGLDPKKTAIVNSGNGLHFYVLLKTPFVNKNFFDLFRDHYNMCCEIVNEQIREAGLFLREKSGNIPAGGLDPSVFEARRIMRLPGTINRKEGKPDKLAHVVESNFDIQTFDLVQVSGIPTVKAEDQMSTKALSAIAPKIDNKGIFDGCGFMRFARDEGAKLTEPQWYAALSIAGRMQNGTELAHAISKQDKGYDASTTERKLTQSLSASGPRTCKSISKMFEGCKSCPHFNTTLVSPITLKSPETITTEHTGFYDMYYDEETGKYKRGKPNFEDLRRYFVREVGHYFSSDKICMVWDGQKFVEYSSQKLLNFAQEHFDPKPLTNTVEEFKNLVYRTNLVDTDFWANRHEGKINFQNGVLEIETGELVPHNKDFGFCYVLPYDFDPKAKCPTVDKFFKDFLQNDPELIAIVWEYLGYVLSGMTPRSQVALVLQGEGSNGKSTFIDLIRAVVGKANASDVLYSKLSNDYYRVGIENKLVNFSEEMPKKGHDSDLIKVLLGGGTTNARSPYKPVHEFRVTCKFIFLANKLPDSSDPSFGFLRRLLIIHLLASFTEDKNNIDVFILDKMLEEKAGVVNKALAHFRIFAKNKFRFTHSDKVIAAKEDYSIDINPVKAWFNEWVTIEDEATSAARTSYQELLKSFLHFCEEMGYRPDEKQNIRSFMKAIRTVSPVFAERAKTVKEQGICKKAIVGVKVPEIFSDSKY